MHLAALLLLPVMGGKAQPGKEHRQQDQHHGRDERAVRNGAAGLEAALGPLVSDGYYDSFVSNGPDALFFLGTAELLSLTVEPTDIQLAEETEDGQTLQVTLQVNGEDTVEISVTFGLDKDGKLESMQILDDLGQLTQTLMGA